jgi:DNA-binding transcriptional ArsR family regulator
MASFKEIDPLLHSRIRLAIMSVLVTVEEADFNYLKESTGATDGNLSTHIYKLVEAKYIKINKEFVDNKPKTMCKMTEIGKDAFSSYVKVLESMLHPK